MGLINWIFDIYHHSKIDEAREEASRARAEAQALRLTTGGGSVDAARLEAAIGELALATKTLQRAMVEKGLITHGEYARLMERVDQEDGRADGRAPM